MNGGILCLQSLVAQPRSGMILRLGNMKLGSLECNLETKKNTQVHKMAGFVLYGSLVCNLET